MLLNSAVVFSTVFVLTSVKVNGTGIIIGMVIAALASLATAFTFDAGCKIAGIGNKYGGLAADKVGFLGKARDKLSTFNEDHPIISNGISCGLYGGLTAGFTAATLFLMGLGSGPGLAAMVLIGAAISAAIGLASGAFSQCRKNSSTTVQDPEAQGLIETKRTT